MRKIILSIILAVASAAASFAQQAEIIYISKLYTTHLVFDTEIKYGDLSNTDEIVASIVDRSKNILSVTALTEFESSANVTVLESNGRIHTFLLLYEENPDKLIIDKRYNAGGTQPSGQMYQSTGKKENSGSANSLWQMDAPPLQEVLEYPCGLNHLAVKKDKVVFMCENIFSYSDITYIIFSLENNSGVSFEVSDATFRIEPRDKKKRKLISSTNITPQNKVGTLTAAAGQKGKVAYALDKLSLSGDQVLTVDLYEHNGQRHFEMSMTNSDINLAVPPAHTK